MFLIMSIRHVLPTPWLSIQFTFLSYWWKDYSNGLGSYFATLSYGQQNPAQKCLTCYFVRQNIFSSNLFLFRPSDTKIQTAIIWWWLQQRFQKFENVRLWASIFRYEYLKIVPLTASELFNQSLSTVHLTIFKIL